MCSFEGVVELVVPHEIPSQFCQIGSIVSCNFLNQPFKTVKMWRVTQKKSDLKKVDIFEKGR